MTLLCLVSVGAGQISASLLLSKALFSQVLFFLLEYSRVTSTCNEEYVTFSTDLKTTEKLFPSQKESQIKRNLIFCSRCATVRAFVYGHSKPFTTENKKKHPQLDKILNLYFNLSKSKDALLRVLMICCALAVVIYILLYISIIL